ISRAFTEVLLICPKVDEFRFRLVLVSLASAKLAWFSKLKNSVRNCKRQRSVMAKSLKIDPSMFHWPGPRRIPRPELPYVPAGAGKKAALLMYACRLSLVEPDG